jgi:predicted transcriptional regulator
VKVEILKLERDRDKAFRELGSEVYNLVKKDKALASAQNEKMRKTVSKIDSLIKFLKSKENEIEKIKKEAEKDTVKSKTQSETQKKSGPAKKPQTKSTKSKPKA